MDYDIYSDIAKRTNGEIYIGVVGPVRTGKSTFITKFMEQIVIPNMAENKKSVAVTEMPQSASGKTIMTTEPKFVPSEAVSIVVGNKTAKIRLIDCVGYMVDGALGSEENGEARLVVTPWQNTPVPFAVAAAIGTKRVIGEHSTLGIVVTCDGSFTDIKREAYIDKERQVVNELKSLNKPFIVLFNTSKPNDDEVKRQCENLQIEYGVSVVPIDILNADKAELERVLEKVLEEFPMRIIDVDIPNWMKSLPSDSLIITHLTSKLYNASKDVYKMKDFKKVETIFDDSDIFEPISDVNVDMATGTIRLSCTVKDGVFYKALTEATGEEVVDEESLISYVKTLSDAKKNYYRIKDAFENADANGYGVVDADFVNASVATPEIVKKSGQYCVRLRVDAQCLHVIRADINQEVETVYGSKEQCENFVALIESEGYNATVFGRKLSDIINEKLQTKSGEFPENLRVKLKRVITKAVNEKRTGLIYLLI